MRTADGESAVLEKLAEEQGVSLSSLVHGILKRSLRRRT